MAIRNWAGSGAPKLFEHGRHALGNIVQPGFAGLVQLSLHDQPPDQL